MYYLNSRYYDPEIGRFINADDISYLDPNSLNGLNLYAYCGNNPVMNIDSTGRFFLSFLIASIIIGAVVGGITGLIQAANDGTSILGGILGGAITGGAMGGLLIFGGGVALGAIAGFGLVSGLLLSSGVGILAGCASYSVEAGINGTWNLNDFAWSGISGMFKGMTTFGVGFIGSKYFGAFDNILLKPLLKGASTLDMNITYSIVKIIMGRTAFVTPVGEFILKTGIIGSIAAGVRLYLDKVFGT